MKIFFTKGISLIEILIAIGILILLLAVVIPPFSEMRQAQISQNNALVVFNALNKARTNTMSSLNNEQYGVHFETNQVIIFTGNTYVQGALTNEILELYDGGQISNISLSGGGADVYFARLTGSPSATGSITVSAGQKQKIITISPAGGFSIN